MKQSPRPSHRGFSMIEMMVGLLIISFGLLGLISMQAKALQSSIGTEDAQRAALLANEMAVAMFNADTVNLKKDVLAAWAERVGDVRAKGVPKGVGTVTVTSATTARITVTWTPVHSSGAANDTHKYSTDVVIP
jgi:type IV pilus assembly protein PilV